MISQRLYTTACKRSAEIRLLILPRLNKCYKDEFAAGEVREFRCPKNFLLAERLKGILFLFLFRKDEA